MIQRIQSIYLVLALASLLGLFVFPVTEVVPNKNILTVQGIAALLAGFIVFILFQYKNLKQQLKQLLVAIITSIVLVAFLFVLIQDLGLGSLLSLPTPLLLFMAYRGVKKDNDLLKSLNRLR